MLHTNWVLIIIIIIRSKVVVVWEGIADSATKAGNAVKARIARGVERFAQGLTAAQTKYLEARNAVASSLYDTLIRLFPETMDQIEFYGDFAKRAVTTVAWILESLDAVVEGRDVILRTLARRPHYRAGAGSIISARLDSRLDVL